MDTNKVSEVVEEFVREKVWEGFLDLLPAHMARQFRNEEDPVVQILKPTFQEAAVRATMDVVLKVVELMSDKKGS